MSSLEIRLDENEKRMDKIDKELKELVELTKWHDTEITSLSGRLVLDARDIENLQSENEFLRKTVAVLEEEIAMLRNEVY